MTKDIYGVDEYSGYRFTLEADGWRWSYIEPGQETDAHEEAFSSRGLAMLDAAKDWDAAGSGGRLSSMLRGLAKRQGVVAPIPREEA